MFDKFLTLKNKMKCGTSVCVSITLPFKNYEKKVLFYVYMGNQEKKIKSSLLHFGKRGILYQFYIIYITLKYYFEGEVDLTYSDFF